MGLKLEWTKLVDERGQLYYRADCGGYSLTSATFEEGGPGWQVCGVSGVACCDDAESAEDGREAAEAAAARLLAEDAGVRALLGLDELRVRAEKAEIDVECYRGAAQHHYKQYTEVDAALTRVVTKLGNAAIRIAELEAAQRWTRVAEQLPPEGVEVLVDRARLDGSRYVCAMVWQPAQPSWVPDCGPTPLGVWRGHGWAAVDGGDHWRPLPAGPGLPT